MNYKVFTGIDQSKKSFDACVISLSNPNKLQHKKFDNTLEGVKELLSWIKQLHSCKINEILFCAENTGVYCWPICLYLTEQNANLWLENALRIKLSSGLKRGKSDPADAAEIARYAMRYFERADLFKMPSEALLKLKELLSFRERLVKQKKGLKGTLKDLKDMNADLTGVIGDQSREIIMVLEVKIKLCDEKMLEIIKSEKSLKEQFDLVCSVHGVGKQTALFILVYTQGFSRFTDPRKFACYCGVVPFEYYSGTSIKGRSRVSHLANKKLKSLLTMCALNTIKKQNELKDYYDRKVEEGKNPMSVINAIRNKLVLRIFATVRRGTPYTPVMAAT